MKATNTNKPPTWFWIISGAALLWNLMGVSNFVFAEFMGEAMVADLTQAQRLAFESIPTWATVCFAAAVFTGTLASIGLLLRKKWAKPLFIVSLITAATQFFHWLFLSDAVEAFGPSTYGMPITVLIIGVFLIFYSGYGVKKGWLR